MMAGEREVCIEEKRQKKQTRITIKIIITIVMERGMGTQ